MSAIEVDGKDPDSVHQIVLILKESHISDFQQSLVAPSEQFHSGGQEGCFIFSAVVEAEPNGNFGWRFVFLAGDSDVFVSDGYSEGRNFGPYFPYLDILHI